MSSGHVVINGKTYSLAAGAAAPQHKRIDGFAAQNKSQTPNLNVATATVPRTPKKKIARTHGTTSTQPHTSRSQTLNRKAVRKPQATHSTAIQSTSITKPSFAPPKSRLERAQTIQKSPHVGKFTAVPRVEAVETALLPKMAPQEVVLPTEEPPVYNPVAKSQTHSIIDRQVDTAPLTLGVRTKAPKKKRAKALFIAPVAAALVVGASLFAYSNLPQVSMMVASSRAGFDARLPDAPTGFALNGPITYETGKVSVSYRSNTDDRSLIIQQQPSSLDSASLASGFLDANEIDYQEYEVGGKKVFIYGNGEATWVSKGIWYTMEGESRLTNDQILALVNSL